MRASQKSGTATNHLLSVVSHELGITLTQIRVDDETNEYRSQEKSSMRLISGVKSLQPKHF